MTESARRTSPARAVAAAVLSLAGCSAELPIYDPFGVRDELAGCESDEHCTDGRRCQVDTGRCVECVEDVHCGGTRVCTGGVCVEGSGACRSDDDCKATPGACFAQVGTCDLRRGICSYPPRDEGAPCDDGDACTVDDTCDGAGRCRAGAPRVCDDNNPCTADGCDPMSGCTTTPLDDDTLCGENGETCASAVCGCSGGSVELDCSNGIDDDCDGLVDCLDPDCLGLSCEDGDPCSVGEVCLEDFTCAQGVEQKVCETTAACLVSVGLCNPESGECAFEPAGKGLPCDDGDLCTVDETCDGEGSCFGRPKDCGDPPGSCWEPEGTCDPATGECSWAPKEAGVACEQGCLVNAVCDGEGGCVGEGPDCSVPPSPCLEWAGTCDPSGACEWRPKAAGSVCREAGDLCDAPEVCDGVSAECPEDLPRAAGEVCREAQSVCDVPETCTGDSMACPEDGFVTDTTIVCREAEGLCDVAETCSGTSPRCPDDQVVEAGTVCREPAGVCDAAEQCDGVSPFCPDDAFLEAGTVCNPAKGRCDAEEVCDGTGVECPADGVLEAGTVCRAAIGPCDLEEVCDGRSDQCPSDRLAPQGTICREGKAACEQPEVCTGSDKFCPLPLDAPLPAGTVCRPAAGPCDVADVCDGSSLECGEDLRGPPPTSCRGYLACESSPSSGSYPIDPDGDGPNEPLEGYCDFSSKPPPDPMPHKEKAAGFTWVRLPASEDGDQRAHAKVCEERGLQVVVPRTKEHALRIREWNDGEPPNLVNVFPKAAGAAGLQNWFGRCAGGQTCSFWMSDKADTAYCAEPSIRTEPSGDNRADSRLYRHDTSEVGCGYGQWNDADYKMEIPGWVICSTNDL